MSISTTFKVPVVSSSAEFDHIGSLLATAPCRLHSRVPAVLEKSWLSICAWFDQFYRSTFNFHLACVSVCMCASSLDFWMLVFVDFVNGTPSIGDLCRRRLVDFNLGARVFSLSSWSLHASAVDAVSRSDAWKCPMSSLSRDVLTVSLPCRSCRCRFLLSWLSWFSFRCVAAYRLSTWSYWLSCVFNYCLPNLSLSTVSSKHLGPSRLIAEQE